MPDNVPLSSIVCIRAEDGLSACEGFSVHVLDQGCAMLTGCSADGSQGSCYLASGSVSSSRLALTDCMRPPSQPPNPAAQVR